MRLRCAWLLFGVVALGSGSLRAITVTTTADENGTNPGACSLREAVRALNTAASFGGCTFMAGDSEVLLAAASYPVASDITSPGYLRLLVPMTIRGAGPAATILDFATSDDFVPGFSVETDGATLEGFALINLSSPDAAPPVNFQPPGAGAGLTLRDLALRDNLGYLSGGLQIYGTVSSTVTLERVVFEGNRCGGIGNTLGGAIRCTASAAGVVVSVRDTLFRSNSIVGNDLNFGGAVYNAGCSLSFENVTFDSNRISDFAAAVAGGGLASVTVAGLASTVQITNVTFFGNRAGSDPQVSEGRGGGLALEDATSGTQTVTLVNVTFAGNSATLAGDDLHTDGGSTVSVTNVLFGSSATQACSGTLALMSGGGNLDTDGSCGLSGTGDQTVADPGLAAALANHGGLTPTLALLPSSPAVDGGVAVGCPATDQRDAARPQDGDGEGTATCDAGAFELVLVFADGFESGDTSEWALVVP